MDTKKCFKCGRVKPLSEFYTHPQTLDGHANKCKECSKKDARENYANNKLYYQQYDKHRQKYDINRILCHRYNSLKQRSEGRATRKMRVEGKPFLTKEEWDEWCKENMDEFMRLYRIWEASGFDRRYSPSVDRIDNDSGYEKDNLQWLSTVENTLKYQYKKNLGTKGAIVAIKNGKEVGVFYSQGEAARAIHGSQTCVGKVLSGEQKKHKGYLFEYRKRSRS